MFISAQIGASNEGQAGLAKLYYMIGSSFYIPTHNSREKGREPVEVDQNKRFYTHLNK